MSLQAQLQQYMVTVPEDEDWGIQMSEHLLSEALRMGASDLHIQEVDDSLKIQMRQDGVLLEPAIITSEKRDSLFMRLKVLAGQQNLVHRVPFDGRISWTPIGAEETISLRASFLPTINGEKAVLRFPERQRDLQDLKVLGFSEEQYQNLLYLLKKKEGIIFLTGPASSGKSTTAYAMLRYLFNHLRRRCNVVTVEDPVEQLLPFAAQVEVDLDRGLNFRDTLRSLMRQDPNIIFVGEVRDAETARVAVQAGLSGHLVISTIHAGRTSKVPNRLLSMGVDSHQLSYALTGIIAQRLVRRLCPNCREEMADGNWNAPGCPECLDTGIAGRTGLFELVVIDPEIRNKILQRVGPGELAEAVEKAQVSSIPAMANKLVEQGEISAAERSLILGPLDKGEG